MADLIGGDVLGKQVGPLPVGGWVLLVGGAVTAAYFISRNQSSSTTRTIVDQVPVPVGAIAAPDGAPLVMSPIVHANIPGLAALTAALSTQTGATAGNSTALTGNTAAVASNTTAVTGATAAVASNTTAVTGATAAVAKVIAAPVPVPSRAVSRPGYPGYIVRRGSRGSMVSTVQRRLNVVRSAGLVVDGIFGPKTDAAVRAFQRAAGVIVDGVVGPVTWAALWN